MGMWFDTWTNLVLAVDFVFSPLFVNLVPLTVWRSIKHAFFKSSHGVGKQTRLGWKLSWGQSVG